jgi:Rrf2 family protein
MRLTTKVRYGTRAMLDIALNQDRGPVSIKDIAARQELSQKYLERLLFSLQAAGLVRAVRGSHGGYELARRANALTLLDIYRVLEGSAGFVDCTMHPDACHRATECVTQEIWAQMYAECSRILDATSLQDLAERTHQKRESPLAYCI